MFIKKTFSGLKRQIQEMPLYIKNILLENSLMEDFENRPAYQQNDYIAWIGRAKKEETKTKRLNQMLYELGKGGIYMNMDHPASKK